jgi:hypothetical protein
MNRIGYRLKTRSSVNRKTRHCMRWKETRMELKSNARSDYWLVLWLFRRDSSSNHFGIDLKLVCDSSNEMNRRKLVECVDHDVSKTNGTSVLWNRLPYLIAVFWLRILSAGLSAGFECQFSAEMNRGRIKKAKSKRDLNYVITNSTHEWWIAFGYRWKHDQVSTGRRHVRWKETRIDWNQTHKVIE